MFTVGACPLAAGEAIVDAAFANQHQLRVGDTLRLTTPAGGDLTVAVRATYKEALLGSVTVSTRTFDRAFPRSQDVMTLIRVHGGTSARSAAALHRALADFPDAVPHTKAGFLKEREANSARSSTCSTPARTLRTGQPLRHDQHAGALGVRTDP